MGSFIQVRLEFITRLFYSWIGFSKITGKPVCIKQISRATVPEYLQNDDKMQPREFHLHMRAADCAPESVVHIYDWFERATR